MFPYNLAAMPMHGPHVRAWSASGPLVAHHARVRREPLERRHRATRIQLGVLFDREVDVCVLRRRVHAWLVAEIGEEDLGAPADFGVVE